MNIVLWNEDHPLNFSLKSMHNGIALGHYSSHRSTFAIRYRLIIASYWSLDQLFGLYRKHFHKQASYLSAVLDQQRFILTRHIITIYALYYKSLTSEGACVKEA